MKLVNIFATDKEVYLFLREEVDYLDIIIDDTFYPYRFVEDPMGIFTTYDGKKARKVYGDLYRIGRLSIYESDVSFDRQYLLDKVDKIDPAPIRYVFFDIEVLIDSNLSVSDLLAKANKPITCITLYDSYSKDFYTLFINDFEGKNLVQKERKLIDKFITLINEISPDLLLAWNIGFDFEYLTKRYKKGTFAEAISPICLSRWSGKKEVPYPAGISILDYMEMYRKFTLNKAYSYSLDSVLEVELGKGKTHSVVEFGKITDEIWQRNLEDVEGMVKLEEKLNLIKYYDNIRRLTKCLWEDLPSKTDYKEGKVLYFSNNSKIIDMLCLSEARKMGIILPSKRKNEEKVSFKGAFREVFETGLINEKVLKLDLTSAYPTIMKNFCLDETNIVEEPEENTIEINGIYFKQDPNTLLPRIADKLLCFKSKIKEELKQLHPNSKKYKQKEIEYASIKGIVNSLFGVIGLNSFRLFDVRIPETVTFLVRDLLHYVVDKLEEKGYKVIYVDTDSVFVKTKEDIMDFCNFLILEWANKKYGKKEIDIEFEKEGFFEKLFILAKCRYIGVLNTKKGKKLEVKGVEMKRKDSSKFMKEFMEKLINFIFENANNKKIEEELNNWIIEKTKQFFCEKSSNIAFPVRYVNRKYKNLPVFIKALQNTKRINPELYKKIVDQGFYYYIYDKKYEVIAFIEGYENIIAEIDWGKMLERNILNKVKTIYDVLGFDFIKLLNSLAQAFPEKIGQLEKFTVKNKKYKLNCQLF